MNNLIRNLVKSLAKLNQTFNGTLVNQTEISRQQRKIKQIENDFQSFIDTVQSAKDELDDVTLARMSNFLDSAIKGITGIHDLVDGMVENHRKINSDYRSLPVIKGLKRKLTIDLVNLHELRMKENDIFY